MNYSKAFTLIELIVTIAIIAVLSAIVLVGVTGYISKGKDSAVSGSLSTLIPAGEVYYNGNVNSYSGFCNPLTTGTVFKNVIAQMPVQASGAPCYNATNTATTNPAGACCSVANGGQAWAACAKEFVNTALAYCVDSTGKAEGIALASCTSSLTQCP